MEASYVRLEGTPSHQLRRAEASRCKPKTGGRRDRTASHCQNHAATHGIHSDQGSAGRNSPRHGPRTCRTEGGRRCTGRCDHRARGLRTTFAIPAKSSISRYALPVATSVAPTGRMKPGQWSAMKIAQTTYHGGYEGLGNAWGEFIGIIRAAGHKTADGLCEAYAVGPEMSSDPRRGGRCSARNCSNPEFLLDHRMIRRGRLGAQRRPWSSRS